MVVSKCKFLTKLRVVFKSHPVVIRMGDTTFRATWDDTGNVGVVKSPIKGADNKHSDKGEHISMFWNSTYFTCTVRSQTRNTNGDEWTSVQIESEVWYMSHDIRRNEGAVGGRRSECSVCATYLHQIGALPDKWFGSCSGRGRRTQRNIEDCPWALIQHTRQSIPSRQVWSFLFMELA